ncbi:hypothetical protein E2C01_040864 [Portunus trituberculatus]|uniref:Uncharacterized protein n=1 Tax=Portunus trituberculatus TaxID=210409 RepID=A0A5B7FPD1_PORTR|nr:hypothetical protein [Portunus trituberculatus]
MNFIINIIIFKLVSSVPQWNFSSTFFSSHTPACLSLNTSSGNITTPQFSTQVSAFNFSPSNGPCTYRGVAVNPYSAAGNGEEWRGFETPLHAPLQTRCLTFMVRL